MYALIHTCTYIYTSIYTYKPDWGYIGTFTALSDSNESRMIFSASLFIHIYTYTYIYTSIYTYTYTKPNKSITK
jgi:hypothetical protein